MTEADVLAYAQALVETGCPNDCGLIAAAAHAYLKRHGVRSRIMNIRYGKDWGHVVVVFKSADMLSIFDSRGSMNVLNGGWRTPPVLLAKAWTKAAGIKTRVRDAVWHDKKYSQGRG